MSEKPRVLLMILDGWGEGQGEDPCNAIARAPTPTFDDLSARWPHAHLGASGADVGLPKGQMGNSEVGHLNIGAGRIVFQGLTLIGREIEQGTFFENRELLTLMHRLAESRGALHLMGLLSDGGVHSHYEHAKALVEMAGEVGLPRLFVHAFLDGRDTPPKSALEYTNDFEAFLAREKLGQIATVSGRYYAMDRDQHWERTEKAYNALVLGKADYVATSAREAIEKAYARGESDEFVAPTIVCTGNKTAVGVIGDRDGVIFFNFRADRARQMTRALTDGGFGEFPRERLPKLQGLVCLSEYDERFELPVAFRSTSPKNTLGEIVARQGIKQLRIAETEKYAHVTFFFNGGEEKLFEGEDRILVPSPREVASYDQQPQMSAPELTEKLIEAIAKETYGLIVLNYANGDMVGHTGNLGAAEKAVATIDESVGRVLEAARAHGYAVLITADHGNCEQMCDGEGNAITQHSLNPVPVHLFAPARSKLGLRNGRLCDLAPTVLELLGLAQPPEMTGQSLLVS